MKHILLFLSFFFSSFIAGAQERYYNYRWEPVELEKALYVSYVTQDSGLFHRKDFYIRERGLQMDGWYRDSGCKIKQGKFRYFYPKGRLKTKCSFENDVLDGEYMSYHENGMPEDSGFMRKGQYVGQSYSWHKNGYLKDSLLLQSDGSGTLVSWHDNGQLAAAGFYGPGKKRRATWQYFHRNGQLSAKEKCIDGKRVEYEYFDENGVPEDKFDTDRDLEFPGGDKAWSKYVNRHIYFPSNWKLTSDGEAVVIVTATIDEEGKVTDAYVSTPFHPDFDNIALKMMNNSPKWIPAIEHHRRVRKVFSQAINFVQGR